MDVYLDLLRQVYGSTRVEEDRTGVGTRSVFGAQVRFDLSQGFPLLTTKKIHVPSVLHELLWFVRGETNVAYLQEHGVRIWNPWADEEGELGPIYGRQWRAWERKDGTVIDQMASVVHEIKTHPSSRRLLVSAWNPADLPSMALPPCHCLFQFDVHEEVLSCQVYQRSADIFLGVPFNIASYAFLTHMIAHVTHLTPGELIFSFGNLHLYLNHQEQARQQMDRSPRPLPRVRLAPEIQDLFSFQYDSFVLEGYDPHPALPAPIAV